MVNAIACVLLAAPGQPGARVAAGMVSACQGSGSINSDSTYLCGTLCSTTSRKRSRVLITRSAALLSSRAWANYLYLIYSIQTKPLALSCSRSSTTRLGAPRATRALHTNAPNCTTIDSLRSLARWQNRSAQRLVRAILHRFLHRNAASSLHQLLLSRSRSTHTFPCQPTTTTQKPPDSSTTTISKMLTNRHARQDPVLQILLLRHQNWVTIIWVTGH